MKEKELIQDLHSHTYHSFGGKDAPEAVVETAIAGGIGLPGICDHNYGIGYGSRESLKQQIGCPLADYQERLCRYFEQLTALRESCREGLVLLRGIELCTLQDERHRFHPLPQGADISFFDYCLIEHIDKACSCTGGDLFAYAKRCGTVCE